MRPPVRSLDNAVIDLLAPFGPADIVHHRTIDWASATFIGARHEIRVSLPDAEQAVDRIAPLLNQAEVRLPGHVLADMILAGHGREGARTMIDIEALTLIDR